VILKKFGLIFPHHDFIPTIVVVPHVESAPLTENIGAAPAIIENEDVPIYSG
jgi:hypothetical protein